MKKKKLFIILSIVFTISIPVVVCFVIPIAGTLPIRNDYKIFGDITEFTFVEDIAGEILKPDTDKDLKSISFAESKAYKIKYDGKVYNIYAYVFENSNDANSYFHNVTGKQNNRETNFSSSGNFYFSTRLIVLSSNKAYKIAGPGEKKFDEFIKIMNNYLSGPILFSI